MSSKSRQLVFAFSAVIGLIVTWYFNIQFMHQNGGFSLSEFLAAIHVNAAASSISNDILVAAFTFLFWSYFESRRLGMRNWWIYAVLTFAIAFAFAFPLFMLMRERKSEQRL